ncbi:MAG: matrixin family metalloprotease [Candidatus Wallbacteria bacterium]|nr:matrixin family metalloprotease [Candidatus Wallbacteria bacterium]
MNELDVRRTLTALAAPALFSTVLAATACAFSPMRFNIPGGTVPRWAPEAFPLEYVIQPNARQREEIIRSSLSRWTRMPKVAFQAAAVQRASGKGTVIPVFESQRLPTGAAAVTAFDLDGRGFYRVAQIAVNNNAGMSNLAYEIAVTHEIGHSFGLNHSDRIGALMNSFLENRQLGLRPHYDDWAGAAFLHGTADFASNKGAIAGTVRGGGSPIDNVDVIVRRASDGALAGVVRTGFVPRGTAATAGQSRAVGRYALTGLPPGEYVVVTLNSRLTFDGRLNPRSPNAVAVIRPTYHGGAQRWQDAKHIVVQAGRASEPVDIDAPLAGAY